MLAYLSSLPETYLQQQLESVLNGMPIAVSWANLKTASILFQNRKFAEIFGYGFGEHSTVPEWIAKTYVNPEQVQRAVDTWTPHFQTDSIVPIEIEQVEVDVLCKDGSIKTCLHSGMILPRQGWALAIFNDISERKKYEMHIQRMALEDDLTQLANRRAFNKMLQSSLSLARRHNTHAILLLIDLDDFKGLNDSFGHDVGDKALQKAAELIQAGIRDEDFAFRLGGDEFAVILNAGTEQPNVKEVAERLLAGFGAQTEIGSRKISLNMSVGVAAFPEQGSDPAILYKAADEALYRAKSKGKGCWSL